MDSKRANYGDFEPVESPFKRLLRAMFAKASFIALGLACIGWLIGMYVVLKLHIAARVGKTKTEDCGNEYFEQDAVGYHVAREFLEPNNNRDLIKIAVTFLILSLGVCSLGLLFTVIGSFELFVKAWRDNPREWKIVLGFGIIFYRVLVLTLTLLWAYNKRDELVPFSDYSDLNQTRKSPSETNKIVFNQFMVTTTILSLAMFILTFFAVIESDAMVFIAYLFTQYIVNMVLPVLTKYGVEVDNILRMDYQDGVNKLNAIVQYFYNSTDARTKKKVRSYFYKNVNRARTDRSELVPQAVIDRMQKANELYKYLEHGVHKWKK